VAKETAISWTDSTFNPWWGCERVSPACAHCYAADMARFRGFHDLWDGNFRWLKDGHWRKPLGWNRLAEARREPWFVFCASMADVFQPDDRLAEPRTRLLELIQATPWLVWLLLTKRPELIADMTGWKADGAPANVWLGTSIENARHTYRARQLAEVPAPVHFLSCEPLLGSLYEHRGNRQPLDLTDIEWVIAGGESGPKHRPMNLDHARELRDRCAAAAVPFWFKQVGGRVHDTGGHLLDGRELYQRPTPATPTLTLF
jgi:protein gp37